MEEAPQAMSTGQHLEHRVLSTLCRYTSEPTARGILRRAREQRSDGTREPNAFMDAVIYGARLFVDDTKRAQLMKELEALMENTPPPEDLRMPIYDEHSARRARLAVRRIAEELGAHKLATLRAATALSELTRNVLMYARSGLVEIEVHRNPSMLCVVVSDDGPGIPHLEEVLAGRYKSTTGLGRGITGVQKLADGFRIETGSNGTRVRFEMDL